MVWSPRPAPYLARARPEDDHPIFKLCRRGAAPAPVGGRGSRGLDLDRPGPDQLTGRHAEQERRAGRSWPRARVPGPGRLAAGFPCRVAAVVVRPAVRVAEQVVGVSQGPEAGCGLGVVRLRIEVRVLYR